VNSLAYERAGVTESVNDPVGGRFERDSTGRLNGRVAESAAEVISAADKHVYTRDDYQRGVAEISKRLAAAGITSATEAQGGPDELRGFQDARDAGELHTRMYCHINFAHLDKMIAAGVRSATNGCASARSRRAATAPSANVPHDSRGILCRPSE
jgi:predicted amidohydrolase YtcJ